MKIESKMNQERLDETKRAFIRPAHVLAERLAFPAVSVGEEECDDRRED
jgi:hypothetical protein